MNCKPGDLAMHSQGFGHPDDGKIVRVVAAGEDWSDEGDTRFHWECDTLGQRFVFENVDGVSDGVETIDIADACLRPIRDSDGEDEMLRIAGFPQKVTA